MDMTRVPSTPVSNYYFIRYVYHEEYENLPHARRYRRWVPERKLIFCGRDIAPIEVRIEDGKRIFVYDDPLNQLKNRTVKFRFAQGAIEG